MFPIEDAPIQTSQWSVSYWKYFNQTHITLSVDSFVSVLQTPVYIFSDEIIYLFTQIIYV